MGSIENQAKHKMGAYSILVGWLLKMATKGDWSGCYVQNGLRGEIVKASRSCRNVM